MRKAIEVFGEWAKSGRDEKMAQGHQAAVDHMLQIFVSDRTDPFAMIDAGCGNGWVVRQVLKNPLCAQAIGVDGAEPMISRAREIDQQGEYFHADLLKWKPSDPVELVHSMEVLYYFREPGEVIAHMVEHWLKPGGTLLVGLDHYLENETSLDWAEKHNIEFMTTLSQSQWIAHFEHAGLINCSASRFGAHDNWSGTLVLSGKKPTT